MLRTESAENANQKKLTDFQRGLIKKLKAASRKDLCTFQIDISTEDKKTKDRMQAKLNGTVKKSALLASQIKSCSIASGDLLITFKEEVADQDWISFVELFEKVLSTRRVVNKYDIENILVGEFNIEDIQLPKAKIKSILVKVKVDKKILPEDGTIDDLLQVLKEVTRRKISNKKIEKTIKLALDKNADDTICFYFNERQSLSPKEWLKFVEIIAETKRYNYKKYLASAKPKENYATITFIEGENARSFYRAFDCLIPKEWKEKISMRVFDETNQLRITFKFIGSLTEDIWEEFSEAFLKDLNASDILSKRKNQRKLLAEHKALTFIATLEQQNAQKKRKKSNEDEGSVSKERRINSTIESSAETFTSMEISSGEVSELEVKEKQKKPTKLQQAIIDKLKTAFDRKENENNEGMIILGPFNKEKNTARELLKKTIKRIRNTSRLIKSCNVVNDSIWLTFKENLVTKETWSFFAKELEDFWRSPIQTHKYNYESILLSNYNIQENKVFVQVNLEELPKNETAYAVCLSLTDIVKLRMKQEILKEKVGISMSDDDEGEIILCFKNHEIITSHVWNEFVVIIAKNNRYDYAEYFASAKPKENYAAITFVNNENAKAFYNACRHLIPEEWKEQVSLPIPKDAVFKIIFTDYETLEEKVWNNFKESFLCLLNKPNIREEERKMKKQQNALFKLFKEKNVNNSNPPAISEERVVDKDTVTAPIFLS